MDFPHDTGLQGPCRGPQRDRRTSQVGTVKGVRKAQTHFPHLSGNKNPQSGSDAAARMLKYVRELETYITNNTGAIVNYGERYRNGDRISTGFVESTINQVVSKRMVKKQQVQWTPEGAHLLLQVRTQVLNEEWEDTFRTWYPCFRPVPTPVAPPLVAA